MKRKTNSAKWAAVLNDWTKADADAASKLEWGIFDVGSPSKKRKPVGPFDFNYLPFELRSIDETRILKDDAAAFDLVRQLVAEWAFHAIRPLSPPTSGHLFHGHPAGQSERSDAGLHC